MSRALLETIRRRRGFLLNYHRMLAAQDPALLEAYDRFYGDLTLVERHLAPLDREVVWIALLAGARQAQGRIHVDRALALGMDAATVAEAAALAACPPGVDPACCAPSIAPPLAHLAVAACCAVRRDFVGLRHALAGAEELGAGVVTEALSLIMIPAGLAAFFDAATAWRGGAAAGQALLAATAPDLLHSLTGFHDRLVRPSAAAPILFGALSCLGIRTDLGLGTAPVSDPVARVLTGALLGWSALDFVATRWAEPVPGFGPVDRYARLVAHAAGPMPDVAVHLAGLLVHAFRQDREPARLHLVQAFQANAAAMQVAQAIALLRISGSGAAFIAVIEVWLDAARSGVCPAPFEVEAD